MLNSSDEHALDASPEKLAHLVSKILAPLLLLCLTFVSGVSPILIVRRFKIEGKGHGSQTHKSKLISFTACVGGGVLFATAMLHIIPEARTGFETWQHQHEHPQDHDDDKHTEAAEAHADHDHKFPLTEFVVCLGFLFVYCIEEALQACLGHKSHANEDHGHSHSPQVIQCATNGEQANNANAEPYTQISVFNQMEGGNSDQKDKKPQALSISIGQIITVAALSFHSIFEGLFLGIQTSTAKTWLVLLVMAMHKLVISFVLGFELCADGNKKSTVLVYITLFSIMSPIGAFGGSVAQFTLKESTVIVAILNGVAAGTLLFVTFFEVLQKQKNSSLHGVLQLTAVIIGFCIMLGLGQIVELLPKVRSRVDGGVAYPALNDTLIDSHGHSH